MIKMLETDEHQKTHNRKLVHIHIPECVKFISDLVKAGLISGWGNVVSVRLAGDIDPDEARYVVPVLDTLKAQAKKDHQ